MSSGFMYSIAGAKAIADAATPNSVVGQRVGKPVNSWRETKREFDAMVIRLREGGAPSYRQRLVDRFHRGHSQFLGCRGYLDGHRLALLKGRRGQAVHVLGIVLAKRWPDGMTTYWEFDGDRGMELPIGEPELLEWLEKEGS